MKQAKEVKRKIKSIVSIQHITKAMKMVAAAKFKKAQNRLISIAAYYKKIRETIVDMADYLKAHRHPYVHGADHPGEKHKKVRCFIVITGDKGLCGSFNMNVCKEAELRLRASREEGFDNVVITIGNKGHDYFVKRNYDVIYHTPLSKPDPKFEDLENCVNAILETYEKGRALEVRVIYTHYVSTITYKIIDERLLPIDFSKGDLLAKPATVNDFKFEPEPAQILNYLLPRYIKMVMFMAIVESSCSEQGSRMITMGSATDKATELLDSLTLMLNRARQESITSELLDISGGVEALKKSS